MDTTSLLLFLKEHLAIRQIEKDDSATWAIVNRKDDIFNEKIRNTLKELVERGILSTDKCDNANKDDMNKVRIQTFTLEKPSLLSDIEPDVKGLVLTVAFY